MLVFCLERVYGRAFDGAIHRVMGADKQQYPLPNW